MNEHAALRSNAIEYHETSSGTLMGELLRKFWQPVALSQDVGERAVLKIRILSEDLTVYRGESGKPYVVGGRCAHRCTVLHTGIVQGEQISCMYHGWRYDGTGLCTDIPSEKAPRAKAIRIAGYPAIEYGGLIFAFMGNGEPPEFDLPRKPEFEREDRMVFPKREMWDCNWFQQVENSMDAVHLSFAHMWGATGQFGTAISGGGEIPQLEYEETGSGVRQTATRSNGNVRVSDWTFPNNNHIVAPGPDRNSSWGHVSVWAVPIDDTHTMRFRLYSVERPNDETVARIKRDLTFEPADVAEKLFSGDLTGLSEQSVVSAQDYVAVRGQGEIFDRSQEHLSPSDAGIMFLRKVFARELGALRDEMPGKRWERLSEAVSLSAPPPVKA
jgi:5,5'-dehydrodivanillate O-demethylase